MRQPPHRPEEPLRYRVPAPPRPPRRPPGGLRAERHRPRGRLRLFSEARAFHADATERLLALDAAIEDLVDERLVCLDVLVDCRDQLRRRWSNRHNRRRASVDEAPFPGVPPRAKPLYGVDLRSVALTILRRHGPQRLRDLHALIHLYGYCIDSERPVQRLGDAMAYELSQGRVERLERGVYGPTDEHPGPDRYAPPPQDLDAPLPWERPVTDPGPPLLDPDLARDPELWSAGQWPTEDDLVDETPNQDPSPGPAPEANPGGADPPMPDGSASPPIAPASPSEPLGGDSPTNRRPVPRAQQRRWEPPP